MFTVKSCDNLERIIVSNVSTIQRYTVFGLNPSNINTIYFQKPYINTPVVVISTKNANGIIYSATLIAVNVSFFVFRLYPVYYPPPEYKYYYLTFLSTYKNTFSAGDLQLSLSKIKFYNQGNEVTSSLISCTSSTTSINPASNLISSTDLPTYTTTIVGGSCILKFIFPSNTPITKYLLVSPTEPTLQSQTPVKWTLSAALVDGVNPVILHSQNQYAFSQQTVTSQNSFDIPFTKPNNTVDVSYMAIQSSA